MSHSRRSRYSQSPSPYRRYERSVSRSVSVSRSSSHIENPGNNLYVTGLSTRVTRRDLEKHFSAEGKVEDIHLVVDPRTRESRGFGFVTMSSLEEAERCIKYLDGSVLEGRVITVEKARRRRGRTPTPGRYLGLKTVRVSRRSPSYSSSYDRSRSQRDRSRSYSPYYRRRRSRSYSPYHSAPYSRERYDSRSRSPYWSPPGRRDWSYSARYSRERYYSRSRSPYWSPPGRRDRSYSPYNSRYYSPDNHYHRRSRYRCISPSSSPPRGRSYRRCVSPSPRRSYRRSHSPAYRVSRRSYSQSISRSWRSRRDYSLSRSGSGSQSSRSPSPVYRRSLRRSYSQSVSPRPRRRPNYSLSRSCSGSPSSRSVSRSVTPRFASPSS